MQGGNGHAPVLAWAAQQRAAGRFFSGLSDEGIGSAVDFFLSGSIPGSASPCSFSAGNSIGSAGAIGLSPKSKSKRVNCWPSCGVIGFTLVLMPYSFLSMSCAVNAATISHEKRTPRWGVCVPSHQKSVLYRLIPHTDAVYDHLCITILVC